MYLDRKRPALNRKRSKGFSLIELLIVIAIILIILAVALPKLTNARRYAQEMAAVKAITTIHTAQTQYYSQYGTYATTLTQLGPPASGAPGPQGAELIDRDLAGGEKGGFKFNLQQTPTGYALLVNPTAFGTSGSHTYYSDQSMTIHQHNGQEPATANDPLLGETTQQLQQTQAPATESK
ncbi:MAG TPA: prepilin-type N-terminal cleavage/methylation domain-containing protein [Bryobacteraceae bacterium]|nr:prepilin-type N-terminal cleavage/methylation domain-containing protein [Bryobacteraceae bacterium]